MTKTRWFGKAARGEDGATIVETAIGMSVYLALFFGLIEVCLALYSFNFVSDAAREATRYVVVRGANSCTVSASFPNCNLLPTNVTSTTNPANNPVLAFIDTLKYPGLNSSNLSVTVTWWVPSQNGAGQTSWTTQCTGAKDANGIPCNTVGNAVRVAVSYNFPLSVPYWKNSIVKLNSTSQMVINE